MNLPRRTLHLLPNAHLDPVWLWDWREGLNEGLATVRTVVSLMDDLPETAIPVVGGDLGYCLRGCYSSVQKFKTLFRQAESAVTEAESTSTVIAQALGTAAPPLIEAWRAVLYNAFHDILPGSSIERAMDEQSACSGMSAAPA